MWSLEWINWSDCTFSERPLLKPIFLYERTLYERALLKLPIDKDRVIFDNVFYFLVSKAVLELNDILKLTM